LIFGKIITIVATRGQILRLQCTKFYFGWDSAPDPAGGAYSAPPDLLAGFKGPTSKGREGREWKGTGGEGRESERRGGKGRGGNVELHHLLLSNLTTDYNLTRTFNFIGWSPYVTHFLQLVKTLVDIWLY